MSYALPPIAVAFALSLALLAPTAIYAQSTSTSSHQESADDDKASRALWIASAEVGVGPIDEDFFLHLTPRLSFLHPAPLPFCDGPDCKTLFEASIHVPLRLRIIDRSPVQGDLIRQRDWVDASDFFRVLRRLEYGTPQDSFHLRVGEIGPATIGNGTVLNGYYNVITTDHHRVGLTGRVTGEEYGAEILANNLISPNLWALRLHGHPELIFDANSWWRRFSFGLSAAADFTAPTALRRDADDRITVAPNHFPDVHHAEPTVIAGADLRWHILSGDSFSITPFADLNHHFGLGTGLHAGLFWDQNFGTFLQLSSRLEYRLLTERYLPDYFDPLYELTRFQFPTVTSPGFAGPKLRVARTADAATRHGGFGQLQARIFNLVTLSAAFANAEGPSNADLRLRASADLFERSRVGLFYYKFASGPDDGFGQVLTDLFDPEGALIAAEGRVGIWGPVYGHAQFARQWQLRDDGQFDNLYLWVLGLGAGHTF